MVKFIKMFTSSEVTKRLLMYTMVLITFVTLCTIVESMVFHDLSPLTALIDKTFEFAMVVAGFYIWKAKNENLHKYKRDEYEGD